MDDMRHIIIAQAFEIVDPHIHHGADVIFLHAHAGILKDIHIPDDIRHHIQRVLDTDLALIQRGDLVFDIFLDGCDDVYMLSVTQRDLRGSYRNDGS